MSVVTEADQKVEESKVRIESAILDLIKARNLYDGFLDKDTYGADEYTHSFHKRKSEEYVRLSAIIIELRDMIK